MYDAASNVLMQQLSQLSGVGQVIIGGAAQPAVRVELDPMQLSHYGVGLEDIRSALSNTNANAPKGDIDIGAHRWQIYTNDQANHAADYQNLVVAYRNGDPLLLKNVADVEDSVQDIRNIGLADGKPAVVVIVFRQPGANIITTVESVKAAIPQLKAAMPADIDIDVAIDRSTTIRASLAETQRTLLIAVLLVVGVVYVFLRNGRAALIPAVAVPVSIIGTFGAMYLLGFSLDNLSLMALTIATGFVVDDAIVVLENITRHLEEGMPRVQAALTGARDIGFTVVSITVSLVAVFLPILLMGGIVGRLFREFALTLSLAILVSMAISLTTTPMMCALMLRLAPTVQEQAASEPASDRAGRLCPHPDDRARPQLRRAVHADRDYRAERLADPADSEGLLSAAGHRDDDRLPGGGPERLVPVAEPEIHADDVDRPARSGRAARRRFRRFRKRRPRLSAQHGGDLRVAEAARPARRHSSRDGAAAPRTRRAFLAPNSI